MNLSPQQITQLLQAWREGKESALDELMPLVYDELRALAQRVERRYFGHPSAAHAVVIVDVRATADRNA
jgi:hypothetical protein